VWTYTIVGTVNNTVNTEHKVTMKTSPIWTYQFFITLTSDRHDLTLSIIDLLTIRSPIWRYNYRYQNVAINTEEGDTKAVTPFSTFHRNHICCSNTNLAWCGFPLVNHNPSHNHDPNCRCESLHEMWCKSRIALPSARRCMPFPYRSAAHGYEYTWGAS